MEILKQMLFSQLSKADYFNRQNIEENDRECFLDFFLCPDKIELAFLTEPNDVNQKEFQVFFLFFKFLSFSRPITIRILLSVLYILLNETMQTYSIFNTTSHTFHIWASSSLTLFSKSHLLSVILENKFIYSWPLIIC